MDNCRGTDSFRDRDSFPDTGNGRLDSVPVDIESVAGTRGKLPAGNALAGGSRDRLPVDSFRAGSPVDTCDQGTGCPADKGLAGNAFPGGSFEDNTCPVEHNPTASDIPGASLEDKQVLADKRCVAECTVPAHEGRIAAV